MNIDADGEVRSASIRQRGQRRIVRSLTVMLRAAGPVGLVGVVVVSGLLAVDARADIALLSVRPTAARVGQVVEVRSGAYKRLPAMLLYLVPKAQVPKPYACGPKTKDGKPTGFCEPVLKAPPHERPFRFVGRLDFSRHPRNVRLLFHVPRVPPGVYQFVIYCDPCHRGEGGTLITSTSPSLRVTR